jgi:hypothetical protein
LCVSEEFGVGWLAYRTLFVGGDARWNCGVEWSRRTAERGMWMGGGVRGGVRGLIVWKD